LVREGRWGYIRNFPRTATWGEKGELADPSSRETFEQSKLDWDECARNQSTLALHRDLLKLRREDPIFSRQDWRMIDGAVVGPEAFLLRWFAEDEGDRLLCVNLGRDLDWQPVTEPLAAAPKDREWRLLWSSEQFEYGGAGTAAFDAKGWVVPGHTAIVLEAMVDATEEGGTCRTT
jgi:maltooligosyltrehalose trehalohydrolase